MLDLVSQEISGTVHTNSVLSDDSHMDTSYSSLKRNLTIGSSMLLGQPIVNDNCASRFTDIVFLYKRLTLQLSKFTGKSSGIQKTNYLRISLLSFLRTKNDYLFMDLKVVARYNQSYKVVFKGMKILLKWWELLISLLVDNKKPIPNSQKSVYYECISRLLTRFEWKYIDSTNSSMIAATTNNSKKYNFAELKSSRTSLLVKTLTYCINQISTKSSTLLPIQAFIGKVFAICFFNLDGVSNALLFLLNIRINSVILNYRNFFKNELKSDINLATHKQQLLNLFPDNVKYLMDFDRLTYGMELNHNSLNQLHRSKDLVNSKNRTFDRTDRTNIHSKSRKLNFNAIQPPNSPVKGIADPQGFWVKKWCNYNSDIFNSFLRHYLQQLNLIIDTSQSEISIDDLYYLPGTNIIFSHIYDIIVWTIKTSIANNSNNLDNNNNTGNPKNNNGNNNTYKKYGSWGSRFNILSINNPFSSNINNNITLGFYNLESNKFNNSLLPISKIFYTIRDFLYNNYDFLNCYSIEKLNLNDLKFKKLIITKFDKLLVNYAQSIYAHDFFRAGYILDLFQEFLIQTCTFNTDLLQDENDAESELFTSEKNEGIFGNNGMSRKIIISFITCYFASGIDWDFWLTAVQNMLLTLNINSQLKALSFLFNIWDMIPDINADEDDINNHSDNTFPTLKKVSGENRWYINRSQSIRYNFAIWLTSTKNWINLFCNWQSLVRSYYLRFIVWRLLNISYDYENSQENEDHRRNSDNDDDDDENYGLFFDVSRSVIKDRPKFHMSNHQGQSNKSSYVNHEKLKKIISDRLNLSYEKIIKISEYSSIGHYMMPDMNGTTAIANKKFVITPLKPTIRKLDPLQNQLDLLNASDTQDEPKSVVANPNVDSNIKEKNINTNTHKVSTIKRKSKRFSFSDLKNIKKSFDEDNDDELNYKEFFEGGNNIQKNDTDINNSKLDNNMLDAMDDVLLHGLVPSLNAQLGDGNYSTAGQIRRVSPFEIFDDAVYSSTASSLMDNHHNGNKTNNCSKSSNNNGETNGIPNHGSHYDKDLEKKLTLESKTNSTPALFSIKRSHTKKNKETANNNLSAKLDCKNGLKALPNSNDKDSNDHSELKPSLNHTKSISLKSKSFSNLRNHNSTNNSLSRGKIKSSNNIDGLGNEALVNENGGKIFGFAIKLFKRSKSSGNLNSSCSYDPESNLTNSNENATSKLEANNSFKEEFKNVKVTPPLPNLKNIDLLTPQDIETIRHLNLSEHSFTDSTKLDSLAKKSNKNSGNSSMNNINQLIINNQHFSSSNMDSGDLDLDNESFSISFDDYSSIDSFSEKSTSGKLLRKKTSIKSLKTLTNSSLKVIRKKSGTLSSSSLKSMSASIHSNSSGYYGNNNSTVPGTANSHASALTPKKSSLDSLISPPEFKIKVPDVERQIFKFSLVSTEMNTNYQLSIIKSTSYTKFYNPMSYYNFKEDNKFPQYPLLPFGEQSGGIFYYATDEECTRYTDLSIDDTRGDINIQQIDEQENFDSENEEDDDLNQVECFENLLISERRISQGTFYSCNIDFYHDTGNSNGILMIEEDNAANGYYNNRYQTKIKKNTIGEENTKQVEFNRERAKAQRILKKWNVVGKSLNEWNEVVHEYEDFMRSNGSSYDRMNRESNRINTSFNVRQVKQINASRSTFIPLLIAEAPAPKVNAS